MHGKRAPQIRDILNARMVYHYSVALTPRRCGTADSSRIWDTFYTLHDVARLSIPIPDR